MPIARRISAPAPVVTTSQIQHDAKGNVTGVL